MKLTIHLFTSIIMAAALYPAFGIYSFLAIVGGFLIDIDHIFVYFWDKRNISLKGTYDYCLKEFNDKGQEKSYRFLFVFHTFEVFFLILMFSIIYTFMLPALFGFMMHNLLDIIEESRGVIVIKNKFFLHWLYIQFKHQ